MIACFVPVSHQTSQEFPQLTQACVFCMMKRQLCPPAAWGNAGKEQVHPQETGENIDINEIVEYLWNNWGLSDGGSLWLTNPAHGLDGLTLLHGCPIPTRSRQTAHLYPPIPSLRCFCTVGTLWYWDLQWAKKITGRTIFLLGEIFCTELQKCWYQVYFFNMYDFNWLKISLTLTILHEKKTGGARGYWFIPMFPSYKQVFLHACCILLG